MACNAVIEEVSRMQGDSVTERCRCYINYLRRKIDAGSRRLIRAVRGAGYQNGGNHYTS